MCEQSDAGPSQVLITTDLPVGVTLAQLHNTPPAAVFGIGPRPAVWAVVRWQRPRFPLAWHIAELKSIMKSDRTIKKMDGQSSPWVWLALCPPQGPPSWQKVAPWQAPLGMGFNLGLCFLWVCLCMCVCSEGWCPSSSTGGFDGRCLQAWVYWVWGSEESAWQ